MAFALLGWPPDGPTLRLDYRRFAYAGKFVIGATGKAVVYDADAAADDGCDATATDTDDAVLAAASFSPDRTDDDCLCVRYITVRDDRQGGGLGSRLLAFVAHHADARGYDRVRIAVNNPIAFRAAYRAGFGFTGDETGLAELVCERPGPRDAETYRDGMARYRGRDFDDEMASFLDAQRGADPPDVVDPPDGVDVADGDRDVEPWS